ncbi:MAG: hypothetical protein RR501_06585 [Cloacibacillus sp.]
MAKYFIPCASVARASDIISAAPEGSEIYFTAAAHEAADLRGAFGAAYGVCGFSAAASMTLEAAATGVIDAAEKLGGFEKMLFAPALSSSAQLFLDLPEDEFASHMEAAAGFFNLCKCAIPYMMGQPEAEIIVALPLEAENATTGMFRATMTALCRSLSEEFSQYGIGVKVI